jgi:hypothetical protein
MSLGVRSSDDLSRFRALASLDVRQLPTETAQLIDTDPQLQSMVGQDHVVRDVPGLFARLDQIQRAQATQGATSLDRADGMLRSGRSSGAVNTLGFTGGFNQSMRPGIFGAPLANVNNVRPTAEDRVAAMNNDQLLDLAEKDPAQLSTLASEMRKGPTTFAKQVQLDRISRATFTPGAGLRLNGNAQDQAAYLHMTRLAMLESPSFARLMNQIGNDAAHPVTINLERNTGTLVDSFARQTLDLSDLEKLPAHPTQGHAEQITRGEVLAHMMREQREGALQTGPRDIAPAHRAAIQSENDYRREIGQQSMRLMPPNDETRTSDQRGSAITIHFDDHHDEALLFDTQGNLSRP